MSLMKEFVDSHFFNGEEKHQQYLRRASAKERGYWQVGSDDLLEISCVGQKQGGRNEEDS